MKPPHYIFVLLSALLVGCATVGDRAASPGPVLTTASPPTKASGVTPGPVQSDRVEPSTSPSARPTGSPDHDADARARARAALEHWADVVAETGPDPIVFTSSLTRGGGWRGRDAGDRKSAFGCGGVRAFNELPGEPVAGEVVWHDGTSRPVQLLSAEAAVTIIAERGSRWCQADRFLEVTGARLTEREVATTRGPAVVPVWEFVFIDRDRPTNPITHTALDPSEYLTLEDWPELDSAVNTEWAVGRPESSELTIAFTGAAPGRGPCQAEYTGEAVVSDTGVVVMVTGHSDLPSPRPIGPIVCPAVGYIRAVTVSLSQVLGNRTVLDHWSGLPVALYPQAPDGYPRI